MLFGSCHPRAATSVAEKNAQHLARSLPYDPVRSRKSACLAPHRTCTNKPSSTSSEVMNPPLQPTRFGAASQRCILCWGLASSRTICSNSTSRAVPLLPLTGPVVPHNRQRAAQPSSPWISTTGTTLRSLCLHRSCECFGLDTLYSSS